MARIRTIKPEFFTSEDIVALSPLARLLYVALWCEADREGRMVWKPKTFKIRYLPADSCDIDALCKELLDADLIHLYGEGYAHIPSFLAHQHINPRETASQLPEPTRKPRVGTRKPRDSDAQGGREGKGKEVDTPVGFASFWETWPKSERKHSQAKCLEVWRKKDCESVAEKIIAHVEALKSGEQWQDPKFIPAPLVYLNQSRWTGVDFSAPAKDWE